MKFIVVDDDEINLIITKVLLSKVLKATEVQTFNNAEEGLRFLTEYNGEEKLTLFLDLNMPILSGWDFLEYFRKFDSKVKAMVQIYILSSSVDPWDRTKASAYPDVVSFVSKPLTAVFLTENFEVASKSNYSDSYPNS